MIPPVKGLDPSRGNPDMPKALAKSWTKFDQFKYNMGLIWKWWLGLFWDRFK